MLSGSAERTGHERGARMSVVEQSSVGDPDAAVHGSQDGDRAGAFYSHDFEWEDLRAEIEDSPHDEECVTADGGDHVMTSDDSVCGAWDSFHRKHRKSLFFKERRYLLKEFPELLSPACGRNVLEVGCGTGSSVVPILRGSQSASVYGCDCSTFALERVSELVKEQAGLNASQIQLFHPFLCDVSCEALPSWLCCSSCRASFKQDRKWLNNYRAGGQSSAVQKCCCGGVDITTLMFTLSSIPLSRMRHVLTEIETVLRPGGWLLFRDYGLYDMSMLRFPPSQRVSDRLYLRKDGTLSYFFSLQFVKDLFTSVGLMEEELYYCCVELRNRQKDLPMKRVWIHGKFMKPFV